MMVKYKRRYVAAALISIGTLVLVEKHLPLWRDTIFHCADGGVVRLPCGQLVPTNRWINLGPQTRLNLLQIGGDQEGPHHLGLESNSDYRISLVNGTTESPMIVRNFRISGPGMLREFWVSR
jgi:hypothetical protein